MSMKDVYLSMGDVHPIIVPLVNATQFPDTVSTEMKLLVLPVSLYFIPSVVTLICCVLALSVTLRGRVPQQNQETTWLVVSLVISMLLLSSLSLTYLIVLLKEKTNIEDVSACYVKLFQRGLSAVSCLSLACVALNRYLAICWPLRYYDLLTRPRTILLIACSWVTPCLLLLLASLVDWQEFCDDSRHSTGTLATYAAMYLTGGSITVVLYVLVAYEFRRPRQVVNLGDQATKFDKWATHKTTAAALMAATLCFLSMPHTIVPFFSRGSLPLDFIRLIHLSHRFHIVLFLPLYAKQTFNAVCQTSMEKFTEMWMRLRDLWRARSKSVEKMGDDDL